MNRFMYRLVLIVLACLGGFCAVATSPGLGLALMSLLGLLLLYSQPKHDISTRDARRQEALQRQIDEAKERATREREKARGRSHLIEQYFVLEQRFRALGEGYLADEMHAWATVLKEAQDLEQALADSGVRKKVSAPVPSSGSILDPFEARDYAIKRLEREVRQSLLTPPPVMGKSVDPRSFTDGVVEEVMDWKSTR